MKQNMFSDEDKFYWFKLKQLVYNAAKSYLLS
jgi:hypothetical protein